MACLNKVLLMGNLTRDPQISYLPSKMAVVEVGIAVNRRFKGANGEIREEANFIDCRAYGKTAETISKHFKKGKPIFIEGRLKYDAWEDANKKKQSKIRVVIEKYGFVDSKKEGHQEPVAAIAGSDAFSECEVDEDFDV
jgi:single-strand DNA-binding protein